MPARFVLHACHSLLQICQAGLEAVDPRAAEILESRPFGIVRPALTPAHERDYPKAALALPQVLNTKEEKTHTQQYTPCGSEGLKRGSVSATIGHQP